jgi:hypothetical protein
MLLCSVPTAALAADWDGIDTKGGHQINGARTTLERDNPSPVEGASSAWPMITDDSYASGAIAQIGYAKSLEDWGDSRVHYFYEYENAGNYNLHAKDLGVMPADYTGHYDKFTVYLNSDDGTIHFVLNGGLRAQKTPDWTPDRGLWMGEIRVDGDHFPGDPSHKVDFTECQRYYGGQWIDVNTSNSGWRLGPTNPNFSDWWPTSTHSFQIWDIRP